MQKSITMKKSGMLLGAVFTAMSTQIAHAGHWVASPPAIGTPGDGTADVDHYSEPHCQAYNGPQPGANRDYPLDTATKVFIFTWVKDGAQDDAPEMNVRHDYSVEGGPMTGTRLGTGSRSQAWVTLSPSPSGTVHIDTNNGSPNTAAPMGGSQFLGVFQPRNDVIEVRVNVSAEGSSHLTVVPGGWAKTDMKGLRITSFRVVISPVEVLGGGPDA